MSKGVHSKSSSDGTSSSSSAPEAQDTPLVASEGRPPTCDSATAASGSSPATDAALAVVSSSPGDIRPTHIGTPTSSTVTLAAPTGPDDIDHRLTYIADVTKHARAAWFALLAFLAFAGSTFLGVKDADFFAYGTSISLPLLGVSIPTTSFFYVAPFLIVAFYVHLHLYLMKLWREVADLPTTIDDKPVGERVVPWLVTDWALSLRGLRRDSPLRRVTDLIVLVMVWVGPVFMVTAVWWRVIRIRDKWLIAWTGLLAAIVIVFTVIAWAHARRLLADIDAKRSRCGWIACVLTTRASKRVFVGLLLLASVLIAAISIDMVECGRVLPIARADLRGAQLSIKPDDWWPYEVAKADFEAEYRRRLGITSREEWTPEEAKAFYDKWRSRRRAYLAKIQAPSLVGRDLRYADLTGAFLVAVRGLSGHAQKVPLPEYSSDYKEDIQRTIQRLRGRAVRLTEATLDDAAAEGADLTFGYLAGAQLRRAHMADADLRHAVFDEANLFSVQLEGADLRVTSLKNAQLSYARLEWAVIESAHLQNAILALAQLQDANLKYAHLEGAQLSNANLERADLASAHLEGARLLDSILRHAILTIAHLEGANLTRADMTGAKLEGAFLQGARLCTKLMEWAEMAGAHLEGAILFGADLSNADVMQFNIDKAIGDKKTKLPMGLVGKQLTIPYCWKVVPNWPELPKGVARPWWWDDVEFHHKYLLCPTKDCGHEPGAEEADSDDEE